MQELPETMIMMTQIIVINIFDKLWVQDNEFLTKTAGEKSWIFNRTCSSFSPNSKYKIDLSTEPSSFEWRPA